MEAKNDVRKHIEQCVAHLNYVDLKEYKSQIFFISR